MNALEAAVLRTIGENVSSPDVFSDITPIRDSVSHAVQEICMLTGSYTQKYHLPLYGDRYFYRMAWPVDHFGYVIECWDRQRNYKLGRTDILSLAQYRPWFLKDSGDPDEYFEVGNSVIGIDRAPSADGKLLELTCVAIPAMIASDIQPVKLRAVFEQAAIQYAASEFYASRGDANRAKEFLERYIEFAGIMSIHPMQGERMWVTGKGNDFNKFSERDAR